MVFRSIRLETKHPLFYEQIEHPFNYPPNWLSIFIKSEKLSTRKNYCHRKPTKINTLQIGQKKVEKKLSPQKLISLKEDLNMTWTHWTLDSPFDLTQARTKRYYFFHWHDVYIYGRPRVDAYLAHKLAYFVLHSLPLAKI